jgi:hypothetical protein
MNEVQKKMKNYVVFTYFKELSWNLLEGAEKNHEILLSGHSVTKLKLAPSTF